MKKQTRKYSPQPWQQDSNRLDANLTKIQYWYNGIMMTGKMTLIQAKEKVENKTAFVISDTAIGALDDNGFSIA